MKSNGKSILKSPATWIAAVCMIWVIVFAFDLAPILRSGPDWEWNFKPVVDRYRVLPLIAGVILYVPVGLWLRRRRGAGELLAWSVLGGVGLTLAAAHVRGDVLFRLYTITVSGRAAGWHMAAAHIGDLAATLRNWPQFMTASLAYSPHIDHTPPGIVLIFYVASHLLDGVLPVADVLAQPVRWMLCQYLYGYTNGQYASAWLGILMPVWSSLTVLPLYGLGRRVYGEEAGRWAAVWWPLVPGFLMFSPLPNTFYALPSLIVVAILWQGLVDSRMWLIAAAGLLTSILTFLTFTFVPLVLFAGWLTLGAFWLRSRNPAGPRLKWHWPLQVGVVFGLGLSIVWLGFFASTGLSFWNMWQTAQQTQVDIAQIRAYGPWIILDLNDLFMFTGWPLVLLAAIAVWSVVRNLHSAEKGTEGAVMTLAAILTLLAIDLYGTPRGEWGRIMIFMSPWVLLAAGAGLRKAARAGWTITAVQGLVAGVMILCLQVLAPEFKAHAAPVPPTVSLPAASEAVDTYGATFGGTVRLAAASGKVETQLDAEGNSQSTLFLWLTWETRTPASTPYAYTVQPVSSTGAPAGPAVVVSPFADSYPMTCWKPEDGALTDRIKIPLGQEEPADARVDLAIADPGTGQPLDVVGDAGNITKQVQLGPFH